MSDTANTELKALLEQAKSNSKGGKGGTGADIRIPVNVPESYRNKLKVIAAVEGTTMRAIIIEALDKLFEERAQGKR
jgi:hypothetical protein